ncbi:hypothetical protein H7J86_15040 [Mycobacterium hackensackense]|uniref:hypothetical protein n=1 Tax=Mycobacterium hackensackense TaxID=228909 RepID=UPI002265D95F|nr:hypothetical protein [Mycobacterium hackensackense]MCV7253480.1 hypothetical protein [Mycobacterium hackensackense]
MCAQAAVVNRETLSDIEGQLRDLDATRNKVTALLSGQGLSSARFTDTHPDQQHHMA